MTKILAPTGSWESLNAAINAGADAVYFGTKLLNMRANAKNFDVGELSKIATLCHSNNVETYVTVNTIIYEDELPIVDSLLGAIKDAGIDGVIAWDFSVLSKALSLGLKISISTQASISNSKSVEFYEKLGAKCVVLARELSLKSIAEIKKSTDIEIECFAHGAMCVAESGRCFLSQFTYGHSANRGDCLQPCRRQYKVTDMETNKELVLENHFVMSPKDLCTLPIVDKLVPLVDYLKIEGRNRSPDYVSTVVSAYRKAVDAVISGTFSSSLVDSLVAQVSTVYNRKFHTGFYLGTPTADDFTDLYGSGATVTKKFVGLVKKVYNKIGVFEVEISSESVSVNSKILITGKTTGAEEGLIESIHDNDGSVSTASKGMLVGLKLDRDFKVRVGDKLFLLV